MRCILLTNKVNINETMQYICQPSVVQYLTATLYMVVSQCFGKKIISPSIIPSELLNSHKKSEGNKKELATELERITCK